MSEARDRLINVLAQALNTPPENYAGPDLCRAIAEHVVSQVEQGPGFLVYAGKIRNLEIADRFGPSSWEITTEQYPEDLAAWHA